MEVTLSKSEQEWKEEISSKRRLGALEAALEASNLALRELGDSVAIFLARATTYARLGNFEAAVEDVDRVLSIQPGDPLHLFDKGRWSAQGGDFVGACTAFSEILESDGTSDVRSLRNFVLLYRSYCWLKLGRGREALADATQCEDDKPVWLAHELVHRKWLIEKAQELVGC